VKMLVGGEWVGGGKKIAVSNPYTGKTIDSVPQATSKHIEQALAAAVLGFQELRSWTSLRRSQALYKASRLVGKQAKELALTLTREVGKTLAESKAEVARCREVLQLSAEEAKRIHGETVPFDAAPGGEGRRGFYFRQPLGVIVAISPFNFPLNLAAHKIGPALAAGNAIILKPSSLAPLAAIQLGKILIEAGFPPRAISVITGSGQRVGQALVSDPRTKMISFTGSDSVGRSIARRAGIRKTALELGSNSAVVLMEDAGLAEAVPAIIRGACALAGQVCISVQRVFVQEAIYDLFVELASREIEKIRTGSPEDKGTDMGPMISATAAARAAAWVRQAEQQGAQLSHPLRVKGNMFQPLFLTNVSPNMKICCEEAFAPVFTVIPFVEEEVAYRLVNMSRYGLQAGVFTADVDRAWRAAEAIDCGGVIINDVPTYRADLMPYGGMKDSGQGREGPKFAIEEMTDIKLVGFKARSVGNARSNCAGCHAHNRRQTNEAR
jgi:glyceraldehyde-3-phosphate dehydrogenase (NADP+)